MSVLGLLLWVRDMGVLGLLRYGCARCVLMGLWYKEVARWVCTGAVVWVHDGCTGAPAVWVRTRCVLMGLWYKAGARWVCTGAV
eukprot:134786-Pyramimonas_sp.AAC.1